MEIPIETFDIFENNENTIYLFLLVIIILGYFFYLYFYSEKLLEKIEKDLTEMKENIAFYTNKLLLYFNMEGNSIRTTQTTSF
jgi:hypothetical protein